ncbi:MAG: hypothetical protein AAGE84_24975 [Cyanobacteria bacterium P01_G01_bin.39]
MINIVSRLDKTDVFCDLDDFYEDFELNYVKQLKLSTELVGITASNYI